MLPTTGLLPVLVVKRSRREIPDALEEGEKNQDEWHPWCLRYRTHLYLQEYLSLPSYIWDNCLVYIIPTTQFGEETHKNTGRVGQVEDKRLTSFK